MNNSKIDPLQRIEGIAKKMKAGYTPEVTKEKFNRFLGNIIIPGVKNKVEMSLIEDKSNSSHIVDIFHNVLSPHIQTIPSHEVPDHHSPISISGTQVGSFASSEITELTMKKYIDTVMLILADMYLGDSKMTEQMAYYDSLTGIPNRLSLISNAKQMSHIDEVGKNIQNSFSVILFDVDFFKKINERYGHDGGDEALKFIAAHLSEFITTQYPHITDDLVEPFFGRLGGEEFLVILPGVSSLDAKKIADDLVLWIAKNPISLLDSKEKKMINQTIQISAGVSSYDPKNPINREELELFITSQKSGGNAFPPEIGYMIKLADEAGQWAKEHGRNQAIHHEDQKTEPEDIIAGKKIKTELESALRGITSKSEILKITTEFLQKNNS